MISDVIHQALADIGKYLDDMPEVYDGEAREIIDDLSEHMNDVMMYLDTPPGTEREPVAQNETRK